MVNRKEQARCRFHWQALSPCLCWSWLLSVIFSHMRGQGLELWGVWVWIRFFLKILFNKRAQTSEPGLRNTWPSTLVLTSLQRQPPPPPPRFCKGSHINSAPVFYKMQRLWTLKWVLEITLNQWFVAGSSCGLSLHPSHLTSLNAALPSVFSRMAFIYASLWTSFSVNYPVWVVFSW
jgi:hypothetical protein